MLGFLSIDPRLFDMYTSFRMKRQERLVLVRDRQPILGPWLGPRQLGQ